MTVRSRLTLAFFAISVIPLSAVTLLSYYSSERALRRAAEQQASQTAAELGRRMEWVAGDIQRRMAQAWPIPAQPGSPPAAASRGRREAATAPATPALPLPDMAGRLATVLGDAAPMIESLEILPGVPAPPPAPGAAAATGRPATPASPGTPSTRRDTTGEDLAVLRNRLSVDMPKVIDKALGAGRRTGNGAVDLAAWSKAMEERIRQATAGTSAADLQRARQQAEADRVRAVTRMKGTDVEASVQRDGEEIGRIHARINMPRIYRAILPPPGKERGEIGFAIDPGGVVHARDDEKAKIASLRQAGLVPSEGTGTRSGRGWVVVTRKAPSGTTFGIARPLASELRELRKVAARNFGLGFAAIGLVFLGSIPLAASMTRNLERLMHGVRAVAAGDLETRVPVRSSDEFGHLAAAFNQMAEGLAAHQRLVVQQERLQRELELCRQIQNEMLPREPLRHGLAEIRGISIPAREVGGDFFNYFVLPTGAIAVLVGDVSGKGVGAALLMANVQATLRARLPLGQDLSRLAADLDRELAESTPPEVYLTAFIGVVDPAPRQLRYVNAGHNTQYVLHQGSGIERMPSTGRPLALLPGGPYEEHTVALHSGDLLFFYTDGSVEVENEAGEMLGPERLEQVLIQAARPGADVDAVLREVEDAVQAFRGRAEQSDDATLMALKLGAA